MKPIIDTGLTQAQINSIILELLLTIQINLGATRHLIASKYIEITHDSPESIRAVFEEVRKAEENAIYAQLKNLVDKMKNRNSVNDLLNSIKPE